MIRTVAAILLLIALFPPSPNAQLIVNEVLSNAPGGDSDLEWFEIFNDIGGTFNLTFYEISLMSGAVDTTFTFGITDTIPPNSYKVFCRNAIRFEEHFGDSSGLWGDDPQTEGYEILQLPIGLHNSGGTITLFFIIGSSVVSALTWDSQGQSGVSWERPETDVDTIVQSVDPSGSTPGRINSTTKLSIDLALEEIEVVKQNDSALVGFTISNVGINTVDNSEVQLFRGSPTQPDSSWRLIASEVIGTLQPGFTTIVVGRYQFPGLYQELVAVLSDDDRPTNNRRFLTAPGVNFPPLQLSEFYPNPPPGASEWIELKNIGFAPFDLQGWTISDSVRTAVLTSQQVVVPAGDYIVFVDDSAAFAAAYPNVTAIVLEAEQWAILNNNGDMVVLADQYNIEADRFVYSESFDNSHTWSRAESGERQGDWGRSEFPLGSPGEANRVRFGADFGSSLEIAIEPRIVSPDGNGVDDAAVIRVVAPEASGYTLKIYDSNGREVITLEDNSIDLRQEYVWDGRNGSGERLPIGIYIVHFEAEGVESAKKTIVLAR